jgi:hypothetical protein
LTEPTVVWEPQPRQALFIQCAADDVGFGGARGGGKSDAVVGDWCNHESIYGEHAIGLAIRRERTQLVELIERAKQILIPIGHKWHEKDSYFRGPQGGRLRFSYLETDSDADAYQGHSYTRLYCEEMGTFPNEAPINKLIATLRSGHGVPCQMKGTANPGGPGHQWVRARYALSGRVREILSQEFEFENPFTKKKIRKTRRFIPSKVQDNRYLGDDYVANLYQVGSKELVEAWLNGDWDVIQGAFFDCWSADLHVIPPFDIPADWLRFRSGDWGSARPFSFGWWAVAGDDYDHGGRLIPRGALVRYREWYGASKPNTGLKLDADVVARGIVEREGSDELRYAVMDPATFSEDGGPSIAERMNRVLIQFKKATFRRADNKRIARAGALGGWDLMRARLVGRDGRPMIYFFDACKDSIRTIPGLQHDPDKPEDVDTEGEDHAPDEVRYACMSRPWVPGKPAPIEHDKSELRFEVRDGVLHSNMSVKEWVMKKMRMKQLHGH